VLDLTSALYLGLSHPSGSLGTWDQLTMGRPRVLDAFAEDARLTHSLARLIGCERAALASSTLHLFTDLFELLARQSIALHADAGVYPIALWGAERAALRGAPLSHFHHHDPDALADALRRDDARGRRARRPIVIADGFCPGCGEPAPLAAYQELVSQRGGLLVIDDTQALGVLGERSRRGNGLFGHGGGGSLRWQGVAGGNILIAASLAKGFGVPLAVLAGSGARIASFESHSMLREHASPPSRVTLLAAVRALAINRHAGDALRSRLALNVQYLRRGLGALGLASIGNAFPVQTLIAQAGFEPARMFRRLHAVGVRALLTRFRCLGRVGLSLLLNAALDLSDIARVLRAFAIGLARQPAACAI